MPLVYADEPDAQAMTNMVAPGYEMGDIWSIFRDLSTKIGLRDPIAHYEPGVPLPEVFKKYSGTLTYYINTKIPRLRSTTARREIMAQAQKLVPLVGDIAPGFKPGAVLGQRFRDKLAELVQGVRNVRKAVNAAENAYGMKAPGEVDRTFPTPPRPMPETIEIEPTVTPQPLPDVRVVQQGIPTEYILIAGGIFAALTILPGLLKK